MNARRKQTPRRLRRFLDDVRELVREETLTENLHAVGGGFLLPDGEKVWAGGRDDGDISSGVLDLVRALDREMSS